MKHYRDGYIIAKENEIVSENDITKMNQTVKENLSKYSNYFLFYGELKLKV